MLTNEQKKEILTRYKQGDQLKLISYDLNLPTSTIASFIRRNHPALQKWNENKRSKATTYFSQKLAKLLSLPEAKAQAIYETVRDRFGFKKQNCLRDGKVFTIGLDDVLFATHCPYLGIELDYFGINSKADNYPTFDRVDPRLGYVAGNVVLCSWKANRLKNNGLSEEHRLIADSMDRLLKKAP